MSLTEDLSWGERAGGAVESFARKSWPEAISLVALAATAIAAIPGVWFGPWVWLGAGLAIGVFGIFARNKEADSVVKMRREKNHALVLTRQSAEALRDAVKPLARNLHQYLGLSEPHQRLSVYLHREGCFQLVARFAQDPELRLPGRPKYPESQGMIGTVWRRGDAHERVGKGESWEQWVSRFGFTSDDAAAMRMKSQCIAAVRLDYYDQSVGVILIESQRSRGITVEQFEKLRESYITRSLAELLATAGHLIPAVEGLSHGE